MSKMKIDDRTLEGFVLNELPGDQIKEINSRLETDFQLKQRVLRLKDSNEAILKEFPAQQMVPQILARCQVEKAKQQQESKKQSSPLWVKRIFFASPALAAAAVIFFLIFPFNTSIVNDNHTNISHHTDYGSDSTRIKGEAVTKPDLKVYRLSGREVQVLLPGVTALSGDLLQLAYIVPKKMHGIILSIDGNSTVTLHFPANAEDSTLMEAKKEIRLSNAYELDDAPIFERFFFITSKEPISVQTVMQEAKELAEHTRRAQIENIQCQHSSQSKLNQISFLIVKGAKNEK